MQQRNRQQVCVTLSDTDLHYLDHVADTLGMNRSQVIAALAFRAYAEMKTTDPLEREPWTQSAAGYDVKARMADCDRLLADSPDDPKLLRVKAILGKLWLAGGADLEYEFTRNQTADLAWFERKRAHLLAGDLPAVVDYLTRNASQVRRPL